MLQWLKDLFSGWYRETSSTIETSLSPRTELERYIDKRVEELLEPEHWERATTPEPSFYISDDSVCVRLCGLALWVRSENAKYKAGDVSVYTDTSVSLRPDLQQRFREAFKRTWPNKLPVYLDDIAKLERDRIAAGCPGHEKPSLTENK